MNVAARPMLKGAEPLTPDAASAPLGAFRRPAVQFELVDTRAALDALEAEWSDLFTRAARPAHVFQSFGFCWHWANHYLGSSAGGIEGLELAIVTARRDGRLVMVWPLVTQRSRLLTQTFWMGDPVGQYGDALIGDEPDTDAILAAVFDYLKKSLRSDVLWLRHVRADANVAHLMASLGAQILDRRQAPFMDLRTAKDFATFEQRYSAKTRRNRRRLARRLQEKGGFSFVRHHGGEAARELAVEAVSLKAKWLADRGLYSGAVNDERMTRLFADLAVGETKPVPCIVSALKSNGTTAAVEVSFTCKGRLAMHMIAFNLEFEKSGAGVILLEQSLRDGYAEKLDVYDMLAPGDPYKLDWCDQTDDVIDWAAPLSLTGALYTRFYLGFGRNAAKKALKAMPEPLRRLLGIGLARPAHTAASNEDA